MSKATVALVGREVQGSRRTVPRAQARSLRSIDVHHKSSRQSIGCTLSSAEERSYLPGGFLEISTTYSWRFAGRADCYFGQGGSQGPRSRRLTRISSILSPTTTLRYTAGRLSACRCAYRRFPLYYTSYPCCGRADRPGSSGNFQWSARLGRCASSFDLTQGLMQA